MSRLHVLDELDERLAAVDSTVGLIARELVARCRELTLRISQLERDHPARELASADVAGTAGLPRLVGGEDLWRNRWRRFDVLIVIERFIPLVLAAALAIPDCGIGVRSELLAKLGRGSARSEDTWHASLAFIYSMPGRPGERSP